MDGLLSWWRTLRERPWTSSETSPIRSEPQAREEDVPNEAPARDPDRPQDDPWDADAVRYLLGQPDTARWTRGTLMEALRRQPRFDRTRIDEAQHLASAHGVRQVEEPLPVANRSHWPIPVSLSITSTW